MSLLQTFRDGPKLRRRRVRLRILMLGLAIGLDLLAAAFVVLALLASDRGHTAAATYLLAWAILAGQSAERCR